MSLFSNSNAQSGESVGITLMLGELRDMRSVMSKDAEHLRSEIGGVKQSVSELSQAVLRSQSEVGMIKTEVSKLSEAHTAFKSSLDSVVSDVVKLKTDHVVDEARWTGPMQLLKILSLVGAGLAGITAIIIFFAPSVLGIAP